MGEGAEHQLNHGSPGQVITGECRMTVEIESRDALTKPRASDDPAASRGAPRVLITAAVINHAKGGRD